MNGIVTARMRIVMPWMCFIWGGTQAIGAAGQTASPTKLVINGHDVVCRLIRGQRAVLVPLTSLCTGLGAHFDLDLKERNRVSVKLGNRWVRLEIGSRWAFHPAERNEKLVTLSMLEDAPARRYGEIYVPVSLAGLLGATVSGPDAKGGLHIDVETDDESAQWKRLLKLPLETQIRQGDLAITRLKVVAPGRSVTVGTDMVLNLSLSAPGYVQIYQISGGETEPLLAQVGDKIALFPMMRNIQPKAARISRPFRMLLQASQPGQICFVVLATTASTDNDLRDELKSGHAAGEWAIKGVNVEVLSTSEDPH